MPAGASISGDGTRDALEINNLISAANSHLIDIAVVGSDSVGNSKVTESQLIAIMNRVRGAIPPTIPVTTAEAPDVFMAHANLIAAIDLVFANLRPYFRGTDVSGAVCSLAAEYEELVTAAGGKRVAIGGIGWPSSGNAVRQAVASPEYAAMFALQFFSWAADHGVASFYAEAFDETWRSAAEGAEGAAMGIWDSTGAIKSGMNAFFTGHTSAVNCGGALSQEHSTGDLSSRGQEYLNTLAREPLRSANSGGTRSPSGSRALTAGAVALPAAAHTYDLTTTLADLQGGPALIANGGVISAVGYTFAKGNGLKGIGLLTDPGTYTIGLRLKFDALGVQPASDPDGYVKILDFKNKTSDNGLYYNNYRNLEFYPYPSSGSSAITAGSNHVITLTRDSATNILRTYLDGVQFGGDIVDAAGYGVFGTGAPMSFFIDDTYNAGSEASSGIASSIQIWNSALSPTQVTLVGSPALPTTATVGFISPEPGIVNQPYSVAYAVTSGGGTPTGNVTVTDGAGASCTATVAVGHCSLTSTSQGGTLITANYLGALNFAASSGTAIHFVNPVAPGTAPSAGNFYPINNSLADANGGPALVSGGGVTGTSGYTFSKGAGLSVTGAPSNAGTYTIAVQVQFAFDNQSQYTKVLDFRNLTSDNGLYFDDARHLRLYPYASTGSPPVTPGVYHTIMLARDGVTQIVRIYLDGVQYGGDIPDSANYAVFGAGLPVWFFTDDNVTRGVEASGGQVRAVEIWNIALIPAQAAALATLLTQTVTTVGAIAPEPSLLFQSYTVAYTVTAGGLTPSGNVTVSDGTGATCTAPVATGSCVLPSVTPGTKTITVSYPGATGLSPSSSTGTHVVSSSAVTAIPPATHAYYPKVSLEDLQGGGALSSNGGSVSAAGYTFGTNQGLTGSGLLTDPGNYTIAMRVEFDALSALHYTKILDFGNLCCDTGLYFNKSGSLEFFNFSYISSGSPPVNSGDFHVVTLTRDSATNILRTYLDGIQYGGDLVDTSQYAVFANGAPITFFMDDHSKSCDRTCNPGGEASSGVATLIQIWNSALTPPQVAGVVSRLLQRSPQ